MTDRHSNPPRAPADADLVSRLEAVLKDAAGAAPAAAEIFAPGASKRAAPREACSCLIWPDVREPSDLAASRKTAALRSLEEEGFLFVTTPRRRVGAARAALASLRNALWPEFHVAALYASGGGKPPSRILASGSRRALGGAPPSAGKPIFVLAAVRALDAMRPDAVRRKFDTNAPGWSGDPAAPSYGHYRWMRRAVADFAAPAEDERVLDAGCGAGWVGIEAALRGAKVSSFDPSPEMIRAANRNAISEGLALDFKVGFTEEPPFPGGFDVVISAGVISFSPDPERFLDGLISQVRPGGVLVITDVNPGSLGMRFRRRRHPLLPIRELHALPCADLAKRLEARGLRIEGRRHYQLTLPVPYLLHLSERRLKGLGSGVLLALNRAAHALDAACGARGERFFDSYMLRARKAPGPSGEDVRP